MSSARNTHREVRTAKAIRTLETDWDNPPSGSRGRRLRTPDTTVTIRPQVRRGRWSLKIIGNSDGHIDTCRFGRIISNIRASQSDRSIRWTFLMARARSIAFSAAAPLLFGCALDPSTISTCVAPSLGRRYIGSLDIPSLNSSRLPKRENAPPTIIPCHSPNQARPREKSIRTLIIKS
jgi:hypothetical protein